MKKHLIKLIIGLTIITFLLRSIGIGDILETLSEVNLFFMPLIFIMFYFITVIGSFNSYLLLAPINKKIGFFKMLLYYTKAWSFSTFLPGRLGDFSIVYFLKKEEVSVGEATSLVIVDKIISFFVLIVFAIVAVIRYTPREDAIFLVIALSLAFLFVILCLFSEKLRHFVKKYILRKHSKIFTGFFKSIKLYQNSINIAILNLLITVFRTFFIALTTFVMFLSLGQYISVIDVVFISSISLIVKLIPITISGLGTVEATTTILLNTIANVPLEVIGSYIVLHLIVKYGTSLTFFLLLKSKTEHANKTNSSDLLEKIYFFIIGINPINFIPSKKKLVLFGAMGGKFYGDNSSYLFEWMLKHKKEYECVWITNEKNVYKELIEKGFPVLLSKSLKGILALGRAKVGVFTNSLLDLSFFPALVPKKIRLVGLRHGRSVKRVRFARKEHKISTLEKLLRYQENKMTEYVISTSKFISEKQEECLKIGKEKHVVTGYPRNDYLLENNDEKLNLKKYKKTILYSPSWRHGRYPTVFFPFKDFNIDKLASFLEENNLLLLLRPHKNDLIKYDEISKELNHYERKSQNIRLATHKKYSDANSLLSETDIMITDYSAIYHDFLLLDRPILFIPYDFNSFEKKNGFLYDYFKYMPGKNISSFSELMNSLRDILNGKDVYKNKRKKLREIIHRYKDNRSSERVSSLIDKIMKKNG